MIARKNVDIAKFDHDRKGYVAAAKSRFLRRHTF